MIKVGIETSFFAKTGQFLLKIILIFVQHSCTFEASNSLKGESHDKHRI